MWAKQRHANELSDSGLPGAAPRVLTFRVDAFEESLLFRGSVERLACVLAETDVELILFTQERSEVRRVAAGDTFWFTGLGITVRAARREVSGSFRIVPAAA